MKVTLGLVLVGVLVLGTAFWFKRLRFVLDKSSPAQSVLPLDQRVSQEAGRLFAQAKQSGVDLSSGPCLGLIPGLPEWVVDVVHLPRLPEVDNQPENQCPEFRSGQAKHFVELDQNGQVSRIL